MKINWECGGERFKEELSQQERKGEGQEETGQGRQVWVR
jgi:hypothetical protein